MGDTSLMFRFVSVVFGLPGSRVWWGMIRCRLFFWHVVHPMPYWGIFHFEWCLWIFMESPDHSCLWDVHQDDDLFAIFYDDSSVETLGSHLVRLALLGIPMSPSLPLWDAFWTLGPHFVIDLDDRDHTFDERWFHVTCSSDLSHIRHHTGAYFHFGCDLRISMEVTCSMIDDSMSPDLRPIIHLMPYWGIFLFWMRFTDLGGVACLSPFARRTLRWWSIRYLHGDSLVEPLGSHPVRPALFDT